jgi:hypothetical protein
MPDDFNIPPHADRPPTAEEEAAAERSGKTIDPDEVAGHFEHAAKLGADVRGEGEIEPRTGTTDGEGPQRSDDAAGDEGIDDPAPV